jgi:flagellar basal body-associated protein FliL
MKKIMIVALVVVVAAVFVVSAFGMTERTDDFQAIKKAVKENPQAVPGQPAKWFKLLVTDARTGQEKVKITLPLSVMDIVANCVDLKDVEMRHPGCHLDLGELFKELKAAGPMMFLEVQEDDAVIKLWLE